MSTNSESLQGQRKYEKHTHIYLPLQFYFKFSKFYSFKPGHNLFTAVNTKLMSNEQSKKTLCPFIVILQHRCILMKYFM